jgi:foldase protein PrsA
MKNSLIAAAMLATCWAAGGAQALAQEPNTQMVDPNRVVAIVNGEEIKGSEYYRRMEYLEGVGIRLGNQFAEFPPGFLAIQKLIDERLTFQLAKNKGVFPSDEEINGEIKVRMDDNPKMLEQWIAGGGNMDDLKYRLRVQLAEFKIQTFGITITDAEVESHYKEHPDLFTAPRQFKLRLIAVQSADDTKAVDADLAGGKEFSAEATAKSVDITGRLGGEYGTIADYKLSTPAREALDKIKIGQTTQWLTTTPDGGSGTFLKFYLEDIIPAKKMDLDNTLRRVIRRKLMADKGKIRNAGVPKELDQLRAKAAIDIKQPEFADAYKKYMATYLSSKGISQ